VDIECSISSSIRSFPLPSSNYLAAKGVPPLLSWFAPIIRFVISILCPNFEVVMTCIYMASWVSSISATMHPRHVVDEEAIGHRFKYDQVPQGYIPLLWLVVETPLSNIPRNTRDLVRFYLEIHTHTHTQRLD